MRDARIQDGLSGADGIGKCQPVAKGGPDRHVPAFPCRVFDAGPGVLVILGRKLLGPRIRKTTSLLQTGFDVLANPLVQLAELLEQLVTGRFCGLA